MSQVLPLQSARRRSLHLDAHFGAHVLEHDADGVDDLLVLMRLAIFDDEVLSFAAFLVVHVVLVGETVVPTAVPRREGVSVLLVRLIPLSQVRLYVVDAPV